MKPINYIRTNTLTLWWLVWRFFVLTMIIWAIWILWFYKFWLSYISSDKFINQISKSEITNKIKSQNLLSWDEYFSYNNISGFVTNKTWVLLSEWWSKVIINLSWNQERRYDQDTDWFGITNQYIYVSNNSRDSILARKDIFNSTWRDNIQNNWQNTFEWSYISNSFQKILSWNISSTWFYIDANNLKSIQANFANLITQKQFRQEIANYWNSVRWHIIYITLIIWMLFALIFTIFITAVFVFYTLVTWIIWSLFGNIKSFEKAVSISWIPFILKYIFQLFINWSFIANLLVFVAIISAICYYQKSQTDKPNNQKSSEILDPQ